jgi:hypothetical protein
MESGQISYLSYSAASANLKADPARAGRAQDTALNARKLLMLAAPG